MNETNQETLMPKEAKLSFKNKMIWLALLGVLVGFVIKTGAVKKITVGFEDYKLAGPGEIYDINKLQRDLESQQAVHQEKSISENSAIDNSAPKPE